MILFTRRTLGLINVFQGLLYCGNTQASSLVESYIKSGRDLSIAGVSSPGVYGHFDSRRSRVSAVSLLEGLWLREAFVDAPRAGVKHSRLGCHGAHTYGRLYTVFTNSSCHGSYQSQHTPISLPWGHVRASLQPESQGTTGSRSRRKRSTTGNRA